MQRGRCPRHDRVTAAQTLGQAAGQPPGHGWAQHQRKRGRTPPLQQLDQPLEPLLLLQTGAPDGTLARFIALHTAPKGQVWIIDPDRGNRNAFTRHMALHGFVLHEERLHTLASADTPAYKGRVLVYAR